MAKLSGPLFSLSASGAIAKTLVYFPWKGLKVVRQYVVPANPNTDAQDIQRGYLTDAVAAIHAALILAVKPLGALDMSAYSLWGTLFEGPRTWFNQICKNWLDQARAIKSKAIYRDGLTTPAAGQLTVDIDWTKYGANAITAGTFHYGTSKSALIKSVAATVAATNATAVLPSLASQTKYFWQFRPTAHADFAGANSGLYFGTTP